MLNSMQGNKTLEVSDCCYT
uniref:Uncharacterized protein n=1 Tax=Arundo donax TaxID=35708 RepID=A0A0A8YQP8_ARUDO